MKVDGVMVQVNQGHVISKGAFLHAYESTSSDRALCFRMSQQVTARQLKEIL